MVHAQNLLLIKSARSDTTAQPKNRILQAESNVSPKSSSTMRDSPAHTDVPGCCNNGIDVLLVSLRIAESAVLNGTRRLAGISPATVQVALCKEEDAQSFLFSPLWLVPRVILHLASGQLALCNVSFSNADDGLACEDLLIVLPLLQHLCINSKTLLKNNCSELDGTNCADVRNTTTKLGYV